MAEGSPWQDFERLTAFIFEKNGFTVSVGTVKTRDRKRRQYDVIAKRNGRTLLVECKQWSGSRYRLSALKRAVGQHRERAQFYEDAMNTDAPHLGYPVPPVQAAHPVPVIVTLVEEEIRVFEGIPLVPVHRLNAFIRELDTWADGWPFTEFEDEDPSLPEDLPDDVPENFFGSGELPEDSATDVSLNLSAE